MRGLLSAFVIVLVGAASSYALAADDYRVVDHLQIVKTSDVRVDPIQPTASINDLKRDDIAAAQKCKDLEPAAKDPESEAEIINRCLVRNSILNLQVVFTPILVKAVLQ